MTDGERNAGVSGWVHVVGLVAGTAAIWLLLSGYFLPLILAFGVLSVAFTVYIAHRMDLVDHEGAPIHLTWRVLTYLPWLAWEITKANWDVARRVISPSLPVTPTLFTTPASQSSDLGQVIYANSITLTPGTVSMDLEHRQILVHALSREGAADIQGGAMDRRVREIEQPTR